MATVETKWTNRSVKLLGEEDPIRAIVRRARQVTLSAMEEGWSGPPFDPASLARSLDIAVQPREDIADARTVASADGRLSIEFNPNRSRGRVRYSIAHEIAHTFFPDCADAVRHRVSKEEQIGDEWQLEMLCNIAAAELIMPMGSFPDLRERSMSIDDLMALRREYDVSTEALLLRFVRLTNQPCALVAASRQESGGYVGRYRIDYAVASIGWARSMPLGAIVPDASLVSECTAIGFTAKGDEVWPPEERRYHIECVGVPPYPEAVYPRVLGIISDPDDVVRPRSMIRYLVGDAIAPRGDGARIIVHVVNNRSATWGGGFAKQVAIRLSAAQVDFRAWCQHPGNHALGNTHFYGDPSHLTVASMVAQRGYGRSEVPRISYPALEQCLSAVRDKAINSGASVHMPRIGCGQAGGKWEVVSEFVDAILCQAGVAVTVYDLP